MDEVEPGEPDPEPEPEPEPRPPRASQMSAVGEQMASVKLWQLDPEMLKEADMLEWLASKRAAGLA